MMSNRFVEDYRSEINKINKKNFSADQKISLKSKALEKLFDAVKDKPDDYPYACYEVELANFKIENFQDYESAFELASSAYQKTQHMDRNENLIERLELRALKAINECAENLNDWKNFDCCQIKRKIYCLQNHFYIKYYFNVFDKSTKVIDDALDDYFNSLKKLLKRNAEPEIHKKILDELNCMSQATNIVSRGNSFKRLAEVEKIFKKIRESESAAKIRQKIDLMTELKRLEDKWQEIDDAEQWCASTCPAEWDDSELKAQMAEVKQKLQSLN